MRKVQSQIISKSFLNFINTEFAAATLICWPIMLLHREKKTSLLVVKNVSLYFFIRDLIILSFVLRERRRVVTRDRKLSMPCLNLEIKE